MDWETTVHGLKMKIGFGVTDSRGREVGALIFLTQERDGVRLTVCSARNGKSFGAYPGSAQVKSMDSGKALGLKKAEAVRKRVLKAASKTGGVYLTAGEARRASKEVASTPRDGDVQCTHCNEYYWSSEGHCRVPLCPRCK